MPCNAYATADPVLRSNGYSPLPLLPGKKRPASPGWQACCDTLLASGVQERYTRSFVAYGVGVALGYRELIALDLDTEAPAVDAAIRSVLPPSPVAKRGAKGRTDFYRDPARTIRARKFKARDGAMLVEVLARGNQTVVPPTLHPVTGEPYAWLSEATLLNTPVAELPPVPPDLCPRLAAALAPWLERPPCPAPSATVHAGRDLTEQERRAQGRYASAILDREAATLASMPLNSGRNHATFRLACRVGRWAHHGIIGADAIVGAILAACEQNGLIAEDGHHSVMATIASGLRKSAADALPNLGVRHG
jgi:hypothetical protein